MDYHELEDVIDHDSPVLVLTKGLPGPWGLAAKALFEVKGIDYLAAAQRPDQDNALLSQRSGQTSAPVVFFNDEKPAVLWNEIILLVERIKPEPPLVPGDTAQRALMFGLIHELVGPEGFGWNRRLQMFQPIMQLPDPGPMMASLGHKYGYSEAGAQRASKRCLQILDALGQQLSHQEESGSEYFIGTELCALDIYWAIFAGLVLPLPQGVNPMPPGMREMYTATQEIQHHTADKLFTHRDMMYQRHLSLPLDY